MGALNGMVITRGARAIAAWVMLIVCTACSGGSPPRAPNPMIMAITSENAERIETLLASGVNVNSRFGDIGTWLDISVSLGKFTAATVLLEHGADVNSEDKNGESALMFACQRKTEFVKTLIDKGADVNHKSHRGLTPLMIAATFGQAGNAKLLLRSGADMKARDSSGATALDKAKGAEVTELLGQLYQDGL